MKKVKILSLILALILVLTACGNQGVEEPAESSESTASESETIQETEEKLEEETEEASEDASGELAFEPGTYTYETKGMQGPLTAEVTVDESSILEATVTEHQETPGIGDVAIEEVSNQLVETQSLDLDVVSGATITSRVLMSAYEKCLEDAGADVELLKAEREREYNNQTEYEADVVIVGAGGAGLTAASAALENGASVVLLEKTGIVGGNSLVVGGFMNAPLPELQNKKYDERQPSIESLVTDALAEEPVSDEHKALQDEIQKEYDEYLASDLTFFDSENWFALQTWNAGDKVGDLDAVKMMTANADDRMQWLIDNGMPFKNEVVLGGGALYTRSRYAELPNGTGYISTLKDVIEKNNKDNFTLLKNTEGTELIMDGDRVVGVKAKANDSGQDITINANKAVILTTGGFAGNVELRVKYCEGEKWPNLGEDVKTTNMKGVTGDGIFMAEEAGAELVNMEQIQLLPYCNPETGQVNDTLGGGDGSTIFVNKEGERFVREDGRRDDMSKAIIEQTDGMMYMFADASTFGVEDLGDIKTLGGQSVSYFLDNNLNGIVTGETVEEIAEKIGCSAVTLQKTLDTYNQHVEEGTEDEFGRVTYVSKVDEGPFIAWPRKPATHHTMGGVLIDNQAHALREDGSIVEGLYCAGEITGVLHGANRVGGNAIVDYLTFGYEAGTNAATGK